MHVCPKCKKIKRLKEFGQRSNGSPTAYCKECKREYDRNYWHKTHKRRLQRKRINIGLIGQRNAKAIWEYLKEHPCVECGETDPIVLEFHHEDKKIKEVSYLRARSSLDTLYEEIGKCVVLCANCHRRLTARQYNWYKNIRA